MLIFLDRFLQFHPAAHQRDRSEDHSEGSAAGDCAPTGFRWYDFVADHHQHLRTSKKKEAEGYQHLRRCCQATPGEQKDPCADWCWGMHVLWYYAVVWLELPLNEHILLSKCLNAFSFFPVGVRFMWNTRLSIQRWDLCTTCCGLSWPSRPPSNVWHWLL